MTHGSDPPSTDGAPAAVALGKLGGIKGGPARAAKLQRVTQNIEPKMRFSRPMSVKVDQEGKVYVVDCYRHRAQVYQKLAAAR